jgi:cellulose synthase (UDP-forming)
MPDESDIAADLPATATHGPGDDRGRRPLEPPDDDQVMWYLGPQSRWVQLCMTAGFALAAFSVVRFSATSPWFWPLLVVLVVNTVSAVMSMLSGLNRRRITARSHLEKIIGWVPADGRWPSVDVFLPTCGESEKVLANTYRHIAALDWPGRLRVWVMDDSGRAEVAAMARERGFEYLSRPDRGRMKKAGNLAYAYNRTDGDVIAVFDADFCPRPDYLRHLVPYLDDPRVGIVQSPQFFDTDEHMSWLERTAGATQELFYRWVQPSRDRAGAPICVGTCALYRRAALAAAGGFAQIEHSEDVHTGVSLMEKGYGTQYVPVVVAKGLCPDTLSGFLNQQYRWCSGSMSLLASGRTFRRTLSARQRICFWSGFLYYICTAMNVFAAHVPALLMAVFFADQVRPAHYVPFLVSMWVSFVLLPRMTKGLWRFEVLRIQMAYSFCHAVSIVHRVLGRTAGWVATGSVRRGTSLARTISVVGSVVLAANLAIAWVAVTRDVQHYGLRNFWMMVLFLVAYTYLALPLLFAFVRVLLPESVLFDLPSRVARREASMAAAVQSTPLGQRVNPHDRLIQTVAAEA